MYCTTNNGNKPLWSFDCIMICSLLGLILGDKSIKKLCFKYHLFPKDKKFDPAYGYYRLHHACHEKEGKAPTALTRHLNTRYSFFIEQIRNIEYSNTSAIDNLLESALKESPGGVLWALLTDPRNDVQSHGVYYAHKIILKALRSYRGNTFQQDSSSISDEHKKDQSLLEQSEKRIENLHRELEQIKMELKKTKENAVVVSKHCKIQSERIRELEQRPAEESKLRRELRKLQYELEQSRAKIEELELKECSNEPEYDKPLIDFEKENLHKPIEEESYEEKCAVCPLEALKVAVIGGLDRLEPRYRETVEKMGAQLIFHNGDCKKGCNTLKNMVCGSDIVVFITSVNSHSAMFIVKAECKKSGKKFYVMRETGPAALEKKLLAVAVG